MRGRKPNASVDDSLLCSTPSSGPQESSPLWTPGCWSGPGSDSSDEEATRSSEVVAKYNEAMRNLSEVARLHRPSVLNRQVKNLNTVSTTEMNEIKEKASEACALICNVIAPNDGEKLFNSLRTGVEPVVSNELVNLMKAYSKAPTRNLRTQILSLYAHQYPLKTLQKLHEPYAKLTQWQIRKARAHAEMIGPGGNVSKPTRHRICLNMTKVDHFIDFINRPYYHQDVAFGTRTLKLDSGESVSMPNVIRTVTRSTMVAQYLKYCKDENFDEPLSRSTLFRILEVREASQRKSLQGLDNTAAEGTNAFKTLRSIVDQLKDAGNTKAWALGITKRLDKAKQYLKTDYKVSCQEETSLCADHCRVFALNDPDDKDFKTSCDHLHTALCTDCEELKTTVAEIKRTIEASGSNLSQEKRDDLMHDFQEAELNIKKWKAHIIRSVNQESAKQNVLETLDDSSVLIVMDWAMKFVQMKFREKQSEWYGKRGMSWHISSVISKDTEKQTNIVTSYVHLFDSCTQDWFSVASIVEDLLQNVKTNQPNISQAYLRSDEAGCYHNNLLIAALKDIGERVGVSICQYDFSEPQQGKDICDRIICPLKTSVRTYCNEGNDVMTAKDMYVALTNYRVKGTTASVNCINDSVTQLDANKLPNFSGFHNFKYHKDGITVWKAFGIGKGKTFSNNTIYKTHQQATELKSEVKFPTVEGRLHKSKSTDQVNSSEDNNGLYSCNETHCNYTFSSFQDLENHMNLGQHSRVVNNETIYDTIRREWAKKYDNINSNPTSASSLAREMVEGQTKLQQGWALSNPRKGGVRFSQKVREYLIKKFDLGELTGNKADPLQVACAMKNSRDECGDRIFTREEWLTKTQIKGFFSRVAKLRKKGGARKSSKAEELLEDDIIEDFEDDEEENELREELINDIIDKIGVTHPILYDTYNLCELYADNRISIFKVKMLKDICKYFELKHSSKDKKIDLVNRISNFVQKCSCC
jgi:hypothetical protein